MSNTTGLLKLCENMARGLVYFEDEVFVLHQTAPCSTVSVKIYCNKKDRCLIIGKRGSTINAIRTVFHASAAKYGLKSYLGVDED